MDTKEVVALMQLSTGTTLFTATYIHNRQGMPFTTYTFKNSLGIPLVIGDTCVVQSKDKIDLVVVSEVNVPPYKLDFPVSKLKHLMALVDPAPLQDVLNREGEVAHKMAISEVNERLSAYKDQLGDSFDNIKHMLTAPETSRNREREAVIDGDSFKQKDPE